MNTHAIDLRDKVIFDECPTLMAPRFGNLPRLDVGRYRYVIASDGVYVQARSKALEVCVRVSKGQFPYGNVKAGVNMPHGLIPSDLYKACVDAARSRLPNEWGGLIVVDEPTGQYRLVSPDPDSVSPHRLDYSMVGVKQESILLDIHSHGRDDPYFSPIDNKDDQGFMISGVIGNAHFAEPRFVVRLCVHGLFFDLEWTPWAKG